MTDELLINSTQNGYRIALLNNKALVEYHVEKKDPKFTVGDIYLGTVKKIVPGLNACFVDIGYEKEAFLHYFDLGPQFQSLSNYVKRVNQQQKQVNASLADFKIEPIIDKQGKIGQLLTRGQQILVQIAKEPISSKGPRLSCELALAGRYIILVPFIDEINISRKITDIPERKRLFRLISSIKPKNFGVILRTASEKKEVAELDKDLRDLCKKWEEGVKALKSAQPKDKIIGEINRASSLLRDLLSESFDRIVTDEPRVYEEIKAYISKIAPEKIKLVKLYRDRVKIFERFNVERQIKALFGQVVNIEGGGYLIIEHTEAMHVIDVNSGSKMSVEDNQEATTLRVNLAAAKEIARQLRLRDMGGIVVIDFIGMRKPENKKQLFQAMKDYLKSDRAKTTVLPLSKLSVMQLTRQRVRPEMSIVTKEQCPSCGGTGQIDASILVSSQIETQLHQIMSTVTGPITLYVHPYLHAYFTKGVFSIQMQWLFKYKRFIKVEKDSSFGVTAFKFVDSSGQEIELEN